MDHKSVANFVKTVHYLFICVLFNRCEFHWKEICYVLSIYVTVSVPENVCVGMYGQGCVLTCVIGQESKQSHCEL